MTDAPLHDPAALTRHIETRYHARHRELLPALAAMAARVEDVHFGDEDVPEGLSTLLQQMSAEMEAHVEKETAVVFRAIRAGGMPGIDQLISVMRAEHAGRARDVAQIRALTGDLTLPAGACGTWTRLYAGLTEFVADLTECIRLEDEVLLPQFEPAGHAVA